MPYIIKLDELSLHILDIVQNSIKAKSSLVHILLNISTTDNLLTITVKDNGSGFDVKAYENTQKNKSDTDSSVNNHGGYGIPLFKESAEITGGFLRITSTEGKGTEITAAYILNSPKRLPLGDINATVETLFFCCTDVDFVYTYKVDEEGFTLSTKEIKELIGNVPINNPDIAKHIKALLKENTDILNQNRIF